MGNDFQSLDSSNRVKQVPFIRVWDEYSEGEVPSSHIMGRHKEAYAHSENIPMHTLCVMLMKLMPLPGWGF